MRSSLFHDYANYRTDSLLLAKSIERATPHRRLDVILSGGAHVGALIAWAVFAIFVGLVLAAFA